MEQEEPCIGSLVSVTTHTGIRFEGKVRAVSLNQNKLALLEVRSFGTEGRNPDGPQIPPSDSVFETVVFNGNNIKEMCFANGKAQRSSSPAFNDPTVIQIQIAQQPSADVNTLPSPDVTDDSSSLAILSQITNLPLYQQNPLSSTGTASSSIKKPTQFTDLLYQPPLSSEMANLSLYQQPSSSITDTCSSSQPSLQNLREQSTNLPLYIPSLDTTTTVPDPLPRGSTPHDSELPNLPLCQPSYPSYTSVDPIGPRCTTTVAGTAPVPETVPTQNSSLSTEPNANPGKSGRFTSNQSRPNKVGPVLIGPPVPCDALVAPIKNGKSTKFVPYTGPDLHMGSSEPIQIDSSTSSDECTGPVQYVRSTASGDNTGTVRYVRSNTSSRSTGPVQYARTTSPGRSTGAVQYVRTTLPDSSTGPVQYVRSTTSGQSTGPVQYIRSTTSGGSTGPVVYVKSTSGGSTGPVQYVRSTGPVQYGILPSPVGPVQHVRPPTSNQRTGRGRSTSSNERSRLDQFVPPPSSNERTGQVLYGNQCGPVQNRRSSSPDPQEDNGEGAKYTVDFDFEAMNEKFNKDEMWGMLDNTISRREANEITDEVDETQEDDDEADDEDEQIGISKVAYNKDAFFDHLTSNNPKTNPNDQFKLDTETFGGHASRFGGRGFRGRYGRNGRGRDNYRGRGRGRVHRNHG